ncbi:phenylalanine--tRNA ligase subunit beta [Lewinellaceae bacterium SD302]|nr:phenylalanine--tRNA ligase subunit beta [Lewinellaceae bacterium SD302]
MKTSLNWLRQYLPLDLSPEAIGQVLTGTGLEVEGMDEVESIPGGLAGVVVGHVVECGKHPDADRLSLTKVDLGGGEEPVQIVCGAPNVAQGQKVLVATVGTMLYPQDGEPFKIKKGKIRGQVSMGMICAEDELGLGDDHDGIMVLPTDTPVGKPAAEVYELESDYVYEIGLTPNRSDATNHLGVAFDLAAALKINHDSDQSVQRPDLSGFKAGNEAALPVEIRNQEACPRYAGLTIKDLKIGPAPEWMQNRLKAIGVRPINNVVDITNYVLHEMGQPLHAFDLEKIGGGKIIVQTLPAGSKFLSLDEVERELLPNDLMICDGNDQPMCIAGVFGGLNSGVTDSTTSIFLESAHFDAGYTRRSSMKHNLRTDAAKVFEKGSDPNICVDALKRAALLLQEYAGATVTSELLDIYPAPIEPLEITVRYQRVRELTGIDISREEVRSILETMDMKFTDDNEVDFKVAVPTNKSDVTREVDVIEEILRIYGFDNVAMPQEITTSLTVAPSPDPHKVRELIGDLLSANGFLEMMALSLSESRYYGGGPEAERVDGLVYVNNTSNVTYDIMRPDMLVSGLEAIVHNQNRRMSDLRLFEFGRSYRLDGENYQENNHLTLYLTGHKHAENWHDGVKGSKRNVSYYTLKSTVGLVLRRLGIHNYRTSEAPADKFAYGLRAEAGPMPLVDFGKVNTTRAKEIGVKGEVYHADFHWDNIMRVLPKKPLQVQELNKYPTVRRDLALVVDKKVSFAQLATVANKAEKKMLTQVNLFDVYENDDQLGADKKSYAMSFVFENNERTLKDKEVDKAVNRLIESFTRQLGAEVRR